MRKYNYFLSLLFLCFTEGLLAQTAVNYAYDQMNRLQLIEYPDGSSITYTYDAVGNRLTTTITSPSYVQLNIRTYLQGNYSGGVMSTSLNTQGLIPSNQPYNVAPWNYAGTESVTSIPADVVDWVLIEIRTGLLENTKIATRAAFLKNNGTVVDLDGISQVSISIVEAGNYYVVIRHRNHLSIMSAGPVTLSATDTELYDFTTAQTQAYGNSPMKDLGDGKFGMIAGDIDANGDVDYDSDLLIYWLPKFGWDGYYSEDINLNGTVDYDEDLLIYWLPNFGLSSQVPGSSLVRPSNIQKKNLNDILIRKQNDKSNQD